MILKFLLISLCLTYNMLTKTVFTQTEITVSKECDHPPSYCRFFFKPEISTVTSGSLVLYLDNFTYFVKLASINRRLLT